jgi:predicted phage terminase large subunit-like protein
MVTRYRLSEPPEQFDLIVQSWDSAAKATELNDFSVCTTWGIRDERLFLLGVFRRRLEYPALKRAVREQQHLFQASIVPIEDTASGSQLIQDLVAEGCHGVTRYQPTTDKIVRLHAQTALMENGFVYILETAPWLAEHLHELTVFPKGKHDDQLIRSPLKNPPALRQRIRMLSVIVHTCRSRCCRSFRLLRVAICGDLHRRVMSQIYHALKLRPIC